MFSPKYSETGFIHLEVITQVSCVVLIGELYEENLPTKPLQKNDGFAS